MSDWTSAKNNPDLPDDIFEEITRLYKNKIKLPAIKPSKQFLLCPVGTVGAGKTTVVKPLSEKLNLARISTDEIREIARNMGFNYDRVRDIAHSILKELIEGEYSIAIDGNCGTPGGISKIKEFKDKYRINTIWIYINPPENFIINKLKNYKHSWLFRNGEEAVSSYFKYKEKYGNFSDLNLPYLYTFNTSRLDINNQIQEAFEIIKKSL